MAVFSLNFNVATCEHTLNIQWKRNIWDCWLDAADTVGHEVSFCLRTHVALLFVPLDRFNLFQWQAHFLGRVADGKQK